ncbi:MAG: aldolase/citrate lyase family protein [Saprospiraceae bacterium]|nr:hypothetical protein [Chitinophagia bacterium]
MSIENRFKTNIVAGQKQYGIWNGIPHSYAAEICAGAGFDFVVLDAEHAPYDIGQIVIQLQALTRYPECSPVVRIPNDNAVLMKTLMDAGVQNFIVPMIESAQQASNMVKAIHYPPKGIRGVGTALSRAAQWNRVNDYFKLADEQMCLICQVESVKGVEALDEILEVDGVDIVFLGPADLAGSMGYLGEPGHPEVVETVHACLEKIQNSTKAGGILSSDKGLIEKHEKLGVQMIGVGLDTILLEKATSALAKEFIKNLNASDSNTIY